MLTPKLPGTAARHIGQKVSDRRRQDGLLIEKVAMVLGIRVEALEARERGEVEFTPTELYELASLLRVRPSWFFEDLTGNPG